MEPQPQPNTPTRAKMQVGKEMAIVRWMLRNASKRPASTAMIREGVGGEISGDIYNLKRLGVIIRTGWSTYQIAPEFRDAPMPRPNERYTSRWVKRLRAERDAAGEPWHHADDPTVEAIVVPMPLPPPELAATPTLATAILGISAPDVHSDDDLYAMLDLITGGYIAIAKIGLVVEWIELTRKLVS